MFCQFGFFGSLFAMIVLCNPEASYLERLIVLCSVFRHIDLELG